MKKFIEYIMFSTNPNNRVFVLEKNLLGILYFNIIEKRCIIIIYHQELLI